MPDRIGLDKTPRAKESVQGKLVRIRALFQLLNLWIEWRDNADPALPVKLAQQLGTLAGLPKTKQLAWELREWLPGRSLTLVEHEIGAIQRALPNLRIRNPRQVDGFRHQLDEILWNCQLARVIYKLQHAPDPNGRYVAFYQDHITRNAGLVNQDPVLRTIYTDLFLRGARRSALALKLWRQIQKDSRSFLAGSDPTLDAGAVNQG